MVSLSPFEVVVIVFKVLSQYLHYLYRMIVWDSL